MNVNDAVDGDSLSLVAKRFFRTRQSGAEGLASKFKGTHFYILFPLLDVPSFHFLSLFVLTNCCTYRFTLSLFLTVVFFPSYTLSHFSVQTRDEALLLDFLFLCNYYLLCLPLAFLSLTFVFIFLCYYILSYWFYAFIFYASVPSFLFCLTQVEGTTEGDLCT